MKTGKKLTAVLLALNMLLGLLPGQAFAAFGSAGEDVSEMNAIEAIGIDTSVAPEGFDANDTSNPYGRDSVTVNPVSELLMIHSEYTDQVPMQQGETSVLARQYDLKSELLGHGDASITTLDGFIADPVSKSLDQKTAKEDAFDFSTNKGYTADSVYAGTAVAAGNFSGSKDGQEKQYALLALERNEEGLPGALTLQVLVAVDGKAADAGSRTLISDFGSFGNDRDRNGNRMLQFQIQNYLHVTAGDFDGNGVDEIAVYVPDRQNPRIEVYQYQAKTNASATAYQDISEDGNWALSWSHAVAKSNQNIPNMVSLLAGDFNEDGVEDLAITHSCYYDKNDYGGGYAAVLYGDRGQMLEKRHEFPLVSSDGAAIVRAAFTYGELTGAGTNALVLGGQSLEDLLAENINSRYLAIYQYSGDGYSIVTDKNFDLFAKNDQGGYQYTVMERNDADILRSLPLMVANLAIVPNGLSEAATLYFDSLQFTYQDSGLELTAALDNQTTWSHGSFYVEYGAASADLFGYGYGTMGTMIHQLPWVSSNQEPDVPDYLPKIVAAIYRQFSTIFGDRQGRTYLNLAGNEATPVTSAPDGDVQPDGESSGAQYTVVPFIRSADADGSTSFAFPNTDKDTAYLKYTGHHYFTYSNPEVLAVLASAPYFADLLDRDDLSGNYAESTTSYGKTSGSSQGVTATASISAGAYVSFEQDIKVFGITVASVEASASLTAKFTYDFEKTSTLEQSVEYTTSVGSDAVVLYSIPVVVYEYDSYTPNGDGTYTQQTMTVTSPHTAATQVMELDQYEAIAKDYQELPQISGSILTHTPGDPTSYPSSAAGYKNALVYDGDWAAVNYTGAGGGITVSQAIDMGTETTHSFSGSVELEASAGAGAGGVVVGVTSGREAGAGYVMTSTKGSSYTAVMQNMPIEAKDFGYGLSWKLFAYEQEYYDGGKLKSFPVVNYLVTDVEMPPELPTDFEQDVERTTYDSVALTWSYDQTVAGFQIYRYYEFPDGTGSYELAFVPFTAGVYQDGVWQFEYQDTGLNPYTAYYYQIQTVRASAPNKSIESEVLTARTKTDVGYPELSLTGLNEEGAVSLYPDSSNTVTVEVGNPEDYPQGISYQWQKLTNGVWTDVTNRKSASYTFAASGYSTEGTYRCRVNVIYWDADRGEEYLISAYTETFDAVYQMRRVRAVPGKELTADVDAAGKPFASVTLQSTSANHNVAPSGTVTFEVTGVQYSRSYTVPLSVSGTESTATLAAKDTAALAPGIYQISASYNGNRIFLPQQLGTLEILSGDEGYRLAIYDHSGSETTSVVYGDGWTYKLLKYTKQNGALQVSTIRDMSSYGNGASGFGANLYRLGGNGVTYYSSGSGHYRITSAGTVSYDYGWPWYKETPARQYRLDVSYGGETYSANFAVTPRPITVGVRTANDQPLTAAQGEVSGNLPELYVKKGSLVYGDELLSWPTSDHTSSFRPMVSMVVRDTGGRQVELDDATAPGSYTVSGVVNANNVVAIAEGAADSAGHSITSRNGQKYVVGGVTYGGNYAVTFEPATYVVSGQQYGVTVQVEQVGGNDAGTVSLVEPKALSHEQLTDPNAAVTFSAGASLLFLAQPYEGYRVKQWSLTHGTETDVTEHTNTLSYTMLAEAISIRVEFELADYTLTITNRNEQAGTVTLPKGFANGAVVKPGAELSFTAQANAGYTFSHWEYVVGGSSKNLQEQTITVTMPKSNVYLYPVFVRDSYLLTLEGNLRAWYLWDHDNDITTAPVPRYVTSGAQIPGDTELTVEAAAGYEIDPSARWKRDGAYVVLPGEPNPDYDPAAAAADPNYDEPQEKPYTGSSYTFTMLAPTVISAQAEPGTYDLTVQTGHGTVTVDFADTPQQVTAQDGSRSFEGLAGASAIRLSAKADYGYVFDCWMVDGQRVDGTAAVYTIPALSADTVVEARFRTNTVRTVSGSFNELEGAVRYQVLDPDGTEQDAGPYTSGEAIQAYQGDTVILTAEPKENFMVDKWTVNGSTEDGNHQKTRRFQELSEDIRFQIDFAAQSYYTVSYRVEGGNGSILDATTDAKPFKSGVTNNVGGGATVVITSAPNPDYMVERWTLNGETILKEGTQAPFRGDVLTLDGLTSQTPAVEITVSFTRLQTYAVTTGGKHAGWQLVNAAEVRTDSDGKYYEGETLIWRVTPEAGYRLSDVELSAGSFDRVVREEDGSWLCTLDALQEDLRLTAQVQRLYTVAYTAVEHGTLTVQPLSAAEGELVTIQTEAQSGYRLSSLKALWQDEQGLWQELTISAEKTFRMPAGNVTVSAEFTAAGGSGGGGGGGAIVPARYPITLDPAVGGTLKADRDQAEEGADVRISVTPETGFALKSLQVLDAAGKALDLTRTAEGSYTFRMPASAVHVRAEFTKRAADFSDVAPSSYYAEAVAWAVEQGITTGKTADQFAPNEACTRAQMVTFLWRAAGMPERAAEDLPFTDVAPTAYYAKAVAWAVEQGITQGVTAASFRPDDTVTRAQTVTFLWRAAGMPESTADLPFADVAAERYYAKAVAWAVEQGITTGKTADRFAPNEACTRAQIVTFLWRSMKQTKT